MDPEKWNPEGKSPVNLEGTSVNKQENTRTKQLLTQKRHANDIHANTGYPREERIHVTNKHLHYSIKVAHEVCEDCSEIHKVAEGQDLKLGEMIYLDRNT